MTRRRLLRAVGGAVLGGVAAGVAACRPAASHEAGSGGGGDGAAGGPAGGPARTLTRPVLRPWAEDMVWLDVPSTELPVAYVSMARRQLFVDREYRDRAAWLLGAHISVSTALWRIPLPGDPEREPITPGDEQREFEERSIEDWDPATHPAMDDVRIRRGAPVRVQVELSCVPLVGRREAARTSSGAGAGTAVDQLARASQRAVADGRAGADRPARPAEAWLTADPWSLHIVDGTGGEPIREDFMVIGRGMRHGDRSCSDAGDAVQYVGWAIRD